MSKPKKYKLPPFVAMPWKVLNSESYKALPATAAKLLPYFFGKVKLGFDHPSRCHTDFSFTYSEAKKLGCGKSTFYKVLKDLMRYGFIDPVSKGGLKGGGLSSSIFRLSTRWSDFGLADYKEIKWECFDSIKKQVKKMYRIGPDHGTREEVQQAVVPILEPVEGFIQ
jgi:hypothetical protein